MKDWKKHITTALFIAFILVILFVPSAKATLLRGLMEIGLFKPDVESPKVEISTDLAAIKFKNAKGKIVSLTDLKGKVIFLNFWATWCPPCLAEMPSVNKFYEQFKNEEDVVFLLIDADSNFKKSQAYMDRKKYALPVYTFASDLPETIFNGSLPTTVVFDKKGRISLKEEGAANYSSPEFISFIKQLQQQKN